MHQKDFGEKNGGEKNGDILNSPATGNLKSHEIQHVSVSTLTHAARPLAARLPEREADRMARAVDART